MSTGYTAGIEDNLTFEAFVMRCARAMGALATMRDTPFDAPMPDRFETGNYHAQKIAEFTTTLIRLTNMTEAEAEQAASNAYAAAIAKQAAAIRRSDMLRKKYLAMLAQVKAWQPPSENHYDLKAFMINQIKNSIFLDCDDCYYRNQRHTKLTGAEWRAREEANVREDIAYHEVGHASEIERTEANNTWLWQLRESLARRN